MNPRPAGFLRHCDPPGAAHGLRTPGARPHETTDSIPATPGAWAAGNTAMATQSGAQDREFPRLPLMVTLFRTFFDHLSSHGCARFAIYYRLFLGMSICLVVRFSKLRIIPPPGKVVGPAPTTPPFAAWDRTCNPSRPRPRRQPSSSSRRQCETSSPACADTVRIPRFVEKACAAEKRLGWPPRDRRSEKHIRPAGRANQLPW